LCTVLANNLRAFPNNDISRCIISALNCPIRYVNYNSKGKKENYYYDYHHHRRHLCTVGFTVVFMFFPKQHDLKRNIAYKMRVLIFSTTFV
jgi:hypothetical protein